MCIWCWWFHWGEDGNHTLSHPPPPCDRRYFLPVTEKPHEAHAMHCEAAGRFTVKGLKGSHSRFTLIFSRRETWKCDSVSIQTAGLPFTQTHSVQLRRSASSPIHQPARLISNRPLCHGLVSPAPCPSHMSSNAGNVIRVQWRAGGILGLTFSEIQTCTATRLNMQELIGILYIICI